MARPDPNSQQTAKSKFNLLFEMPEALAEFLMAEAEKLKLSPADYMANLLQFEWELRKQAGIIRGHNHGPCEVTA